MHTLLLGQRAEPITKVQKIISNLITVQKYIFSILYYLFFREIAWDPVRLGLALNFAVFLYETRYLPTEACAFARDGKFTSDLLK